MTGGYGVPPPGVYGSFRPSHVVGQNQKRKYQMENARFILKTGSGIFIFVLAKICTTKQICILINMAQTMLVIRF